MNINEGSLQESMSTLPVHTSITNEQPEKGLYEMLTCQRVKSSKQLKEECYEQCVEALSTDEKKLLDEFKKDLEIYFKTLHRKQRVIQSLNEFLLEQQWHKSIINILTHHILCRNPNYIKDLNPLVQT